MSTFDSDRFLVPSPLVAVAGWLVPGAGYWLIGQRRRGTIIGITVITLFLMGILIAGVRVIEVPGFDRRTGQALRVKDRNGQVAPNAPLVIAQGGLLAEIVAKPWFVPQVLVGPLGLAGGAFSVVLGQAKVTAPHERIAEIGTLYTAVAGMLNLLAVIDSAHRAGNDSPDNEDLRDDDDLSNAAGGVTR